MAITFDAETNHSPASSASPEAFNHTIGGTANPILWVSVRIDSSATLTGITWDPSGTNQAMTSCGSITLGTIHLYLYVLQAPTTGTKSVSIAFTPTGAGPNIRAMAASYFGAAQTGQPDATNTDSSANQATTNVPLTTVADNCWIVLTCEDDSDNTLTASTNATERGAQAAFYKLFDTNAAQTPAGAKTMTITHVSGSLKSVIASMAPVAAGGGAATVLPSTLTVMGVQ